MQRQIDIINLLKFVELSPTVLSFIELPYQEALKGLNSFKSMVLKKKKELAKRYHPDKGGDEERMKEINQAIDLLMTLEMVQARPVRQYYTVFQNCWFSDNTAATSNSTGSVFYGYGVT